MPIRVCLPIYGVICPCDVSKKQSLVAQNVAFHIRYCEYSKLLIYVIQDLLIS